jgi:hypothetical protein
LQQSTFTSTEKGEAEVSFILLMKSLFELGKTKFNSKMASKLAAGALVCKMLESGARDKVSLVLGMLSVAPDDSPMVLQSFEHVFQIWRFQLSGGGIPDIQVLRLCMTIGSKGPEDTFVYLMLLHADFYLNQHQHHPELSLTFLEGLNGLLDSSSPNLPNII